MYHIILLSDCAYDIQRTTKCMGRSIETPNIKRKSWNEVQKTSSITSGEKST